VARNGPPEDFHNQQTQHANYGAPGAPPPAEMPPGQSEPPEAPDAFDQGPEPTPWYRRPAGIIGWVVAVLILLALIVYGLMQLVQGGQGTSPAPSTTTTTSSTTTTTEAPTTTTPSSEPPTSSAAEPPAQQPTQQPTQAPTQQQPTHRHHLPSLPPVITIPGVPNPVTLPPGLR
jgi:hypothetical protein